MAVAAKNTDNHYTYGDYYSWHDGERWELIDGAAFNISPAPSPRHQEIAVALVTILHTYLSDKPCRVYMAPFDVRLPKADEPDDHIDTVVQPDLLIVCDPSKLDDRGMRGSPDLVVEIISPHTTRRDLQNKFALYERHRVREYWIVYPLEKTLTVFTLSEKGTYEKPGMYTHEDQVPVSIFDDLTIDLAQVFKE